MSLTVPISLRSLLRDSAIDAELGALASILVEARVPVIVAGDIDPSIRARVLDALLGALPDDVRRIELAGPTEDFAWLPEAEALGWRSDGPTPGRPAIEPVTAESTVMLAGDLAPGSAQPGRALSASRFGRSRSGMASPGPSRRRPWRPFWPSCAPRQRDSPRTSCRGSDWS